MKFDTNKKKCVIAGEILDNTDDNLEKDIGSKVDFISSVDKLNNNIKKSYKQLSILDKDNRNENLKDIEKII